MTSLVVLAVGLILGRLWARAIDRARMDDCPRCAFEASERRTRVEIDALRRQAEARMAHTAGAGSQDDPADWETTTL